MIKNKSKALGPYTEIFLIRHCDPNYRLQEKLGDILMPLAKSGLKQRKHLTDRLLKMGINVIYTSSITRAIESAEDFARRSEIEPVVEGGLDELDWKHWRNIKYFNMSEEGRKKRFENHSVHDHQLDSLQANVRRVFARIYKENKFKKIAIFCHGNLIKTLLTGILNADVIGFLSMEIYPSSITELIIDKNGYIKIIYINDVTHLPKQPVREFYGKLPE